MKIKFLVICYVLILSFFVLAVYATTFASDITDVAQFGTVTLDHNWKTIMLNKNYTNPVVVAEPISFKGAQPAHIRINNVTSNSFQIKIEEWAYLDGVHVNETVSYLVMGTGTYTINGKKIEAGRTNATNNFTTVLFTENFTTTPVVLTQSQTVNEADPIVTRNRNANTTLFDVRIQEEENSTDGGSHATETVGYIAAEIGIYNNKTKFEVGRTGDSVTHNWFTINFNQTYNNTPSFLADMQTFDESDTAGLRYKNLTNSSVQIKVEEEQSLDSEVNHTTEVVGYFVIK